tara:strand:- start:934 stop:1146 length:213 start_codon:yes stop_codon:yes gene_type:complete
VAPPVVAEEVGASYPEVVREEGPEVVREGEVASFPVVAVEEVASFPVVAEVASSGDRPLAIAAAGRIRRD